MNTSQMELLYRETYRRAYRLRHPRRNKIKFLSAMIFIITIVTLLTNTTPVNTAEAESVIDNYGIPIQAEVLNSNEGVVSDISTDSEVFKKENSANQNFVAYYRAEPPEQQILSAIEGTTEPSSDITPIETLISIHEEDSSTTEEIPASADVVPEKRAYLTEEELTFFEQIVEAEVTGTSFKYDGEVVDESEMLLSKIRVAQVFLNRVDDTEKFSHINTLYESISEPNASSTVNSGRCYEVEVTDLTKEAVQLALDVNTPDYTDGGLFFLAHGATTCEWGDYIFTDKVGHSFFK